MKISNSKIAGSKIAFLAMSEPRSSLSGVLVGQTSVYGSHFFLDSTALLNRHLAVIGMTGSGKTYFLKSYVTRCVSLKESSLLVIDWNGEYSEMVEFLGGRITMISRASEPEIAAAMNLNGICSVSFSDIKDDREKKLAGAIAIRLIVDMLHNMEIDNSRERIILIDEAWKIIGEDSPVIQLFREGRKYGISICIATQLVNDILNAIIANCACIALFRLQIPDDYQSLVSSGIISQGECVALSALRMGECMFHMARKDGGGTGNFIIRRAFGVSNKKLTVIGVAMRYEVTEKRLGDSLRTFTEPAVAAKIMDYIISHGWRVSSTQLITKMAELGLERKDVVPILRAFGVDDIEIVRSYESAKGTIINIER